MRVESVIAIRGLSRAVLAQEDTPKPTISNASLTAEQLMIYRAVVADYTEGQWRKAESGKHDRTTGTVYVRARGGL
jgi:hypothetical protein